jgi:hypothetical protein
MEADLAVGTLVEHSRYGRGRVLGVSEKKEVVRIRFDGLGVKELSYPDSGLSVSPRAHDGGSERALVLRFDGGMKGGPGCRWLIECAGASVSSLVQDISTWANSKAKLQGASISLRGLEKGQMELRISGQGRDGRCRWCRMFRSGLRTAVRRDHGRGAFALEGACIFDEAPRESAPGGNPVVCDGERA